MSAPDAPTDEHGNALDSLETITGLINGLWKKAEDHQATLAKRIAEAKELVEAGDPFAEGEKRAASAERMRQSRENRVQRCTPPPQPEPAADIIPAAGQEPASTGDMYDELVAAWQLATADERKRFLQYLAGLPPERFIDWPLAEAAAAPPVAEAPPAPIATPKIEQAPPAAPPAAGTSCDDSAMAMNTPRTCHYSTCKAAGGLRLPLDVREPAVTPNLRNGGAPRHAVTFFANQFAQTKHQLDCTLAELARNLQVDTRPDKASLPWLKLARFGEVRSPKNSLRHDANVIEITGVEGDYDSGEITFELALERMWEARVKAILYTTPSDTDAKPHWRVLCPLSAPLEPARRRELMDRLNGAIGGGLARESWTLSQSYYFGNVEGQPPIRVEVIDGEDCDYIDQRDDIPPIAKPGGTGNGTDSGGTWLQDGNTWSRGDTRYTIEENRAEVVTSENSYSYYLDRLSALADARRYVSGLEIKVDGCFAHVCMFRDFGLNREKSIELLVELGNEKEHAEERVNHAWSYAKNPPGSKTTAAIFGADETSPEEQEAFFAKLRAEHPEIASPDTPGDDPFLRRFMLVDDATRPDPEPVDVDDLLFTKPAQPRVPCLFDDWLAAGCYIPLSGPGGTHKSRLLAQAAVALRYDLDWIGPDPDKPSIDGCTHWHWGERKGRAVARVEYLSYENDADEDHRRYAAMAQAIGLKDKSAVPMKVWPLREKRSPLLVVSPTTITLTPFGRKMLERWEKLARDGGHTVIILDSLLNAVAFRGNTKVDGEIVQQVVYLLDHWCRLLDATILAAFHPSRAAVSRGDLGYSPEFEDRPRQCLMVNERTTKGSYNNPGEPTGTFRLSVKKWNNGRQGRRLDFRYDEGGTLRTASLPQQGSEVAWRVALDIVLRHTYGDDQTTLVALRSRGLDDKERRQIERRYLDRIRRDGGYGLAEHQAKLSTDHAMIRQFRTRVGDEMPRSKTS